MKHIHIRILTLFFVLGALMMFLVACVPTLLSASTDSQGLAISRIEVESPVVYPLGYSELKCVALAPQGSELKYIWSSASGELSGEGANIRWDAPADYGDYQVMVVVKDSRGNSVEATATVSVIVRLPGGACCGGKICPK